MHVTVVLIGRIFHAPENFVILQVKLSGRLNLNHIFVNLKF